MSLLFTGLVLLTGLFGVGLVVWYVLPRRFRGSESVASAYHLSDDEADYSNSSLLDIDWMTSVDEPDEVQLYMDVYMAFGMLWSFFFLAAIGTTTISGWVVCEPSLHTNSTPPGDVTMCAPQPCAWPLRRLLFHG